MSSCSNERPNHLRLLDIEELWLLIGRLYVSLKYQSALPVFSPELCARLAGWFLALSSLGSARVTRAGVALWVLMAIVYLK